MVGRRMLGLIDMRLRQAFPEKKNEQMINYILINSQLNSKQRADLN